MFEGVSLQFGKLRIIKIIMFILFTKSFIHQTLRRMNVFPHGPKPEEWIINPN